MGVEDHAPSAAEVAEAATSEAQIAVHWREEEYYPPPPSFVAQANAADPAILERFSEEHYPDCFIEYAEMLDVGSQVGHDSGHEQPAVLEVVGRRASERERELRRSTPGIARRQERADLGA